MAGKRVYPAVGVTFRLKTDSRSRVDPRTDDIGYSYAVDLGYQIRNRKYGLHRNTCGNTFWESQSKGYTASSNF